LKHSKVFNRNSIDVGYPNIPNRKIKIQIFTVGRLRVGIIIIAI
jgi:hypothetical protein